MSLDELRRATEQLPGYATMDYYTKCRPPGLCPFVTPCAVLLLDAVLPGKCNMRTVSTPVKSWYSSPRTCCCI
jgi:hypothetical protein